MPVRPIVNNSMVQVADPCYGWDWDCYKCFKNSSDQLSRVVAVQAGAFRMGSIAMVGRATEIASLLNQGNGPYMNSCNLHDRSAPTRSRAQVKRSRDGAAGAYTSTKCLLVQKRACEILTSLPTSGGLEFGKCYNLPTHSGPRIGVQRDITHNFMNSVDASSWSSRGSQVSSELASRISNSY
ncbi:hypothetical protein Tco_1223045 [Tanacetum coccineum]